MQKLLQDRQKQLDKLYLKKALELKVLQKLQLIW
jgi:hypothetical protein